MSVVFLALVLEIIGSILLSMIWFSISRPMQRDMAVYMTVVQRMYAIFTAIVVAPLLVCGFLDLHVTRENHVEVIVNVTATRTMVVRVCMSSTFHTLTEEICRRIGVPVDDIRLLVGSRQLGGDCKVSACGLHNGSTLLVVLRLRGGAKRFNVKLRPSDQPIQDTPCDLATESHSDAREDESNSVKKKKRQYNSKAGLAFPVRNIGNQMSSLIDHLVNCLLYVKEHGSEGASKDATEKMDEYQPRNHFIAVSLDRPQIDWNRCGWHLIRALRCVDSTRESLQDLQTKLSSKKLGELLKDPVKNAELKRGKKQKSTKKISAGKDRAKALQPWKEAVAQARNELKIKGRALPKKGTELHSRAREIYADM